MIKKLMLVLLVPLVLISCDSGVNPVDSCGDGFLDPGEECDKTELMVEDCLQLGYYEQISPLVCQSDCTLDRTMCFGRCGDSLIQVSHGEQCDDTNTGATTCLDLGYYGGTLTCSADCEFLETGCVSFGRCNDGFLQEEHEQCDGTELGSATCESLDLGFVGGALTCNSDCSYNTSACVVLDTCGDGILDDGEDCDLPLLGDATCETLGYYGGVLACNEGCQFDLSSCASFGRCGDGVLQVSNEDCESTDLNHQNCILLGYHGGDLLCAETCHFDLQNCLLTGSCGDGILQSAYEECDGLLMGGVDCPSLGFNGGSLSCSDSCEMVDSDCYYHFDRVAAGSSHSCGRKTDGSIWCWGNNNNGQLGNGSMGGGMNLVTPGRVGTGNTWSQITAGGSSTCGIQNDGSLWCWGWNHFGQLGIGSTLSTSLPQRVGTDSNWVQLVMVDHACGIRSDGSLWCWGQNPLGQLGLGPTELGIIHETPQPVGTSTDWVRVDVEMAHSCGIRSNGSLWCWGYNSYGQLGLGTSGAGTDQSAPQQVGSDLDWADVGLGYFHTCAKKTNGSLWCWGANNRGQLGLNSTIMQTTPQQVGSETSWSKIVGGHEYTCGLKNNGSLWCWGYSAFGSVGLDSAAPRLPQQVGLEMIWDQIESGNGGNSTNNHTCGKMTDGSVWCWGDNYYGQLGLGDNTQRTSPGQLNY